MKTLNSALVKYGFHPYQDKMKQKKGYVTSWQKKITDDLGTQYFIDVTHCHLDYSGVPDTSQHLFSGFAQMTKDGQTFNVELLHVKSVEQCEAFFDNVFHSLKCERYSLFDA